jgi:phosphate/sulfate permease
MLFESKDQDPSWGNVQVASYFGWPVPTTHCIVGAMVGFGIVYGGMGAVYWKSLARVVSSWVVSPALGAAVSFLVYKCIRTVCISYFTYFKSVCTECQVNVCHLFSLLVNLYISLVIVSVSIWEVAEYYIVVM